MPARRPHHRSIWEMTDRASRSFHTARLRSAVRELVAYYDESRYVGTCLYRIPHPAVKLRASVARESVELKWLLEDAVEEASE